MATQETITRLEIDGEIYWEYHGKRYPEICRCKNACEHIAEIAARYCDGVGLDIGAGAHPFSGAFPVRDSVRYIYRNGKQNKRSEPLPNGVNAYNLSCFVDGSLDYIFSSHCLEHLDKPQEALQLWVSKLKPHGILFLYLPHPSMELWRMGSPWVRGAHKWIPDFMIVSRLIAKAGCNVIAGAEQYDKFYSFHIIGEKY